MKFLRLTAGLAVIPFVALFSATPALAAITTAPDLGTAANFAVLAGTALTCIDSNVAGTVGVNFTTAFASTRCRMQVQYAPGAYKDFRTAYTKIAGDLGCSAANTFPKNSSNDESGGTPGDPGRQGKNRNLAGVKNEAEGPRRSFWPRSLCSKASGTAGCY